jgi:hypothetical protein
VSGVSAVAGRGAASLIERKLMNIERPTPNIELMYSVYFNKKE